MNLLLKKSCLILFSIIIIALGCEDKSPEFITATFFGEGEFKPDSSKVVPGKFIIFSRYEVYDDDNHDKCINKGETIQLRVWLRNNGTQDVSNVTSILRTIDPYINISDNLGYYSTITKRSESKDFGGLPYTHEFIISENTPQNHLIEFSLNIRDEHNNEWSDTFQIKVEQIGANLKFSRFQVYADDNNDGVVNKGETIELRIWLKNDGISDANSVTSVLSTTDTYINISDNSGYYGTISKGSESKDFGGLPYTHKFIVSETTQANHVIEFLLSIRDEHNNQWLDTLQIKVEQISADLKFSRFQIYADDNNDGFVNRGETIQLRVWLKNDGSSDANSVTSLLNTTDPYVTISDNSGYYGTISKGNESTNYGGSSYSYTNKFKISENIPTNHVIEFLIEIADEHKNKWNDTFTISVY